MDKKIIMAALAGILTVCGMSLSAQDKAQEEAATVEAKEKAVTVEAISAKNTMKILAVAKPTYKLGAKLTEAQNDESNTFGYILNPDSDNPQFVTLSEALAEKSVTNDGTNDVVSFGRFAKGDKVLIAPSEMKSYEWAIGQGKLKKTGGRQRKKVDVALSEENKK